MKRRGMEMQEGRKKRKKKSTDKKRRWIRVSNCFKKWKEIEEKEKKRRNVVKERNKGKKGKGG